LNILSTIFTVERSKFSIS